MTYDDGFDRTVSAWLDEQAGRGAPDYLDDVLARTTRSRQRPWWSSLERWLPMQSTLRFAQVPRAAWLLVILGLFLAIGTVILVGSPRRPPSPFGPGAHGNVLYAAADGDIYAIDTATNVARPLLVGPAADSGPLVSPDGTRFAFVRRDPGSETTDTFVANADGSAIRQLSFMPNAPTSMVWSPDGTNLAVVGSQGLWIVGPDMAPTLVTPTTSSSASYNFIESPQWRPNGHELIFLASSLAVDVHTGIFLVQTDGSGLRPIVGSTIADPAQPDPVTGRDQGRLFHPGSGSARDPCRRCRDRGRSPGRLRWGGSRRAATLVARWDEARLRADWGRWRPVDDRIRRWRARHGARSDPAGQDRRRGGPVLTGWHQDPGVLQRRRDVLGPRSQRRSGHQAGLRRRHAPDLAGSGALTTAQPRILAADSPSWAGRPSPCP